VVSLSTETSKPLLGFVWEVLRFRLSNTDCLVTTPGFAREASAKNIMRRSNLLFYGVHGLGILAAICFIMDTPLSIRVGLFLLVVALGLLAFVPL